MTDIAFDRAGSGEPLVLIHGTGGSRAVWAAVRSRLERERDVIAVDLPGHGESPLTPRHIAPAPPGYARVLAGLLDDLGIEQAHLAGNSVGGWTALELAKLGRARSVVAIGPAGLWEVSPRSSYWSLRLDRVMAVRFADALARGLRSRAGRTVLMGQTFGRPWKVPPDAAAETIRTFGATRGFREHLELTTRIRFEQGQAIDVPVTAAFGTRERLIPRKGRLRDELPAHMRWIDLEGCGHVPMWDDPDLVARTILEGAAQTREIDVEAPMGHLNAIS
jgi:pimeloyl-ACP methyl ester carboxylesterase